MSKFTISIEGHFTLDKDEIWPNGDAPEDPTLDDVRAVVPTNVEDLVSEWNLHPRVEVS